MSETVYVQSNRFHVTNEIKFRKIMRKVRVYDKGKLKVVKRKNGRFMITGSSDILGYAIGKNGENGHDYESFIADLQTVIPNGEAIIIYTIYTGNSVNVEYDVITNLLHYNYALHNQVCRDVTRILAVNPSDYVHTVEFGVLENKNETDDEYLVYDKKYGYYDEDCYYEPIFDDARDAALDYVNEGHDGSYAIVSQSHRTVDSFGSKSVYDTAVENETRDITSVVYSVAKINGKIVENFVK